MKHVIPPELDSILAKSEQHAMDCTIDSGITNSIYARQIKKGFLTLSVSSKMVKKAIKLYEVFIKRMFKEGCSLTLECESFFHCPASALIVDGEIIPVRVKEKRVLKTIHAGFNQYVPTGVLAIEIYGGTRWNATKTLTETNDCKWSEVFDGIIPYLHSAAKRIKKDRLETEAWQQEMEEKARKEREYAQMIKDRASVVKQIMKDVRLYERAGIIRRYCTFASQNMSFSDDYKDKLAIAMQIADWIDPTIDYVDEILAEKYDVEDFI